MTFNKSFHNIAESVLAFFHGASILVIEVFSVVENSCRIAHNDAYCVPIPFVLEYTKFISYSSVIISEAHMIQKTAKPPVSHAKKTYTRPAVVVELDLETHAGSPIPPFNAPADPNDLTGSGV